MTTGRRPILRIASGPPPVRSGDRAGEYDLARNALRARHQRRRHRQSRRTRAATVRARCAHEIDQLRRLVRSKPRRRRGTRAQLRRGPPAPRRKTWDPAAGQSRKGRRVLRLRPILQASREVAKEYVEVRDLLVNGANSSSGMKKLAHHARRARDGASRQIESPRGLQWRCSATRCSTSPIRNSRRCAKSFTRKSDRWDRRPLMHDLAQRSGSP